MFHWVLFFLFPIKYSCIIAIDDCVLFVKKKGEDKWMIPLGKQEEDKDAETAAQRIARDVAGVFVLEILFYRLNVILLIV